VKQRIFANFGVVLGALSPMWLTAGVTEPEAVRCFQSSQTGCSDGACIISRVESDFAITFDFKMQKYQSDWGSGKIRQIWDVDDGTHKVIVASPPAGAELTFSADWTSSFSSIGSSIVRYRCEQINSVG